MKKSYKMKDVDCANCAAEMTEGIKKLPGVIDANVNFLTQKLSMELEEGVDLGELMPKVVKTCKKVDPECEVLM
ncbi:MAG: cation transporter [Firmicutes bacterium]|jgi:copper chaperone CopZ|nr:cation transporter [Bacillota bacterium]MBR6351761.1 cation transporter [Bacillota bacterium]